MDDFIIDDSDAAHMDDVGPGQPRDGMDTSAILPEGTKRQRGPAKASEMELSDEGLSSASDDMAMDADSDV
jgi:hypothetical protein